MNINVDIYDSLGERWYTAEDDPVALLRAEHRARIPWILKYLKPNNDVLDLGCGGGLLTNQLALSGTFSLFGVDQSEAALTTARRHIPNTAISTPHYIVGQADQLPFSKHQFDVILAMDFLEHIENPEKIFKEVARILKPNGYFLTHTFNRGFLSKWLVIKAVERFIPNTPKDLHVYSMFIRPEEQNQWAKKHGLILKEQWGLNPKISLKQAQYILLKRRVSSDFSFQKSKKITTGYCSAYKMEHYNA